MQYDPEYNRIVEKLLKKSPQAKEVVEDIYLSKSELRKQQIDLFKQVTGVGPELQKVIAVMVLNVRELMHIFRRIWQDFGPFPLIGCDSEGLVWHLSDDKTQPDKIPSYDRHEV